MQGDEQIAPAPEQQALKKSGNYTVRPHPHGGYGVYESGSTDCLQRYDDEDEAWDIVIKALPEGEGA